MTNNLKIALIPILGLILVYLVMRNPTDGEQTSVDPPVSVSVTETPRSVLNQEPTRPPTKSQTKPFAQAVSSWPKFEVDDLQNVDPFDRRALFPDPSEVTGSSDPTNTLVGTTDRSSADTLKPIKIQAIFQSPSGITALVENRVIHIGDRLADGSEVVGITPDQLLLVKPTIH
jgi:hypothetical protein